MVFPGKFRIRAQFFDNHTGSVGIWGCDARSALRGTKAFPLRGRWPEGPDEVAMKESCPNPAPSSVAYGDSFPPRGSLSETTALPQTPICTSKLYGSPRF